MLESIYTIFISQLISFNNLGANFLSEYFQNIIYTVKSVLSGMSLTWDHFINKKKYVSTLQYPNEKWPQPDRNIGFEHSEYNDIRSRLHVDIDDCIGCLQCEKACPVDCIKIDTIKPTKDVEFDCGKTSHDTQKKMIVPRFTIDMSECMYCNLCVYPCPEECIYMVGGPNEPKHEIDYEFSKYVKHDLVFEFSNVTDQEIVDIGAQSYLDKRNEIDLRISQGAELKGGIAEDDLSDEKSDSTKSIKHIDPGFVVFKAIEDKMSRGIAKKAYTYGRRNSMDMAAISKYVQDAINSYNKMTPEMESAINAIIDFKYPNDLDELDSDVNPIEQNVLEDSVLKIEKSSEGLFDIKILNDITDKMIRGSLKKIYMAGKRSDKNNSDLIADFNIYLNDNKLMNDDVKSIIDSINISESTSQESVSSNENHSDADIVKQLFDIKELNSIDDKIIRATSKKIYMACKRSNKNSIETIDEILKTLRELNKLNDDIESFLNKLK